MTPRVVSGGAAARSGRDHDRGRHPPAPVASRRRPARLAGSPRRRRRRARVPRAPQAGLSAPRFRAFVALANLDAWVDLGAAYPSVAILLAAVAVAAHRRPAAFRFRGAAGIALAYGAWVAIAAHAATSTGGSVHWADGTRLVQNGFLAATLTALGAKPGSREGRHRALDVGAALAAGLLGALALAEAAIDLGGAHQRPGAQSAAPSSWRSI